MEEKMKKELKKSLSGKANISFAEATTNLVLQLVSVMEDAAKTTEDMKTFRKLQTGFDKAHEQFNQSKGGQI
jgi:hypothetical protein